MIRRLCLVGLLVPAGLSVAPAYDDSTANRRNPNTPPKDVRWGEGTRDEICLAFLRFTVDSERHPPR